MEEVNDTAQEEVVEEEATDEEATDEEVQAQEDISEDKLLSIDELLELTEEDYPELSDDANHTGMKPLHEWMQHIPEDVRKHVGNLRSSYTRKTQELAELRKELEAEREALRQQQEMTLNNPVLSEMDKHITEDEHDLYSPEGMQAEIRKQAALMLKEMMQPAQEKMQLEQRKMQLEQFKTENPELMEDEYRLPIAEMLQSRPELKLEDAFYIVKAKVDSAKLKAEKESIKQQKTRRRSTLSKTSTGSTTSPNGTPRFKSAVEAYYYHKARQNK